MIVRGREFDEIHDLVGIRVLCEDVRDCYAAIGVVHSTWKPMPGRFKDYIAQPRFGVYRSLHTTVIGPDGKPLEIQIRTHEMHRNAEYGIAAHWRYKETKGKHHGTQAEVDEMAWMRQLLSWQREAADPGEFLDSLRFEMTSKEIFVFTPKGDVVNLPVGATPVDFAYAVHTEVGHRCIGARVNGKLVALERPLENGEVVEVFTSKDPNAGPSLDWQKFVVSGRAKSSIRQWFAKERREEALERGKELITREVRRGGVPVHRVFSNETIAAVARELGFADVTALYTAIGEHHVSAKGVVGRLIAAHGGVDEVTEELADRSRDKTITPHRASPAGAGVLVGGVEDVHAKLARCCTPVPGDEVLGFITRGGTVSVHRTDCTNASDLHREPERLVKVEWAPQPGSVFLVAIQVEALDRHRLLSDVAKVLADEKVNILSASVQTAGTTAWPSRGSRSDGRPQAPGSRPQCGPAGGGRLRRQPDDVELSARRGRPDHTVAFGTSLTGARLLLGQAVLGSDCDLLDLDGVLGPLVVRIRRIVALDAGVDDRVEDLESGLADRAHHRVLGREDGVLVHEEELAPALSGVWDFAIATVPRGYRRADHRRPRPVGGRLIDHRVARAGGPVRWGRRTGGPTARPLSAMVRR